MSELGMHDRREGSRAMDDLICSTVWMSSVDTAENGPGKEIRPLASFTLAREVLGGSSAINVLLSGRDHGERPRPPTENEPSDFRALSVYRLLLQIPPVYDERIGDDTVPIR